jgi:Na+-transporting methylmalonyl-CoA/oxaloacetate decarboxylase gamma subunit
LEGLTFGWVMAVLGMGATLITLFILTLVIRLLIKIAPYKEETKKKSE